MQDHDNNNKSNNVRKMSGGDGRQVSRSGSQSRPAGAPRSSGQPRRPAPDGVQPRASSQPRRQTASGSVSPGAGGQPRPAGQSRSNNGTRPKGQPRPAEPSNQSRPRRQAGNAQPRPNNEPRQKSRPQSTTKHKTPKRSNSVAPQQAAKKKRRKIVLFVAEIFLLLILLTAMWVVKKAQNIQHVELNLAKVHINEDVRVEIEQGTSSMKGYRNIALFGVDSRTKQLDKNTRTDVIMVASINQDTKEVRLVSVYRDTWLNMTNDKYSKANAAYANGGAEQAIGMLNMNLDLDITDFVTVGFDAVIDVVDEIGGVEIDIKQDEIEHLNNYQISMVGRVVKEHPNGIIEYDATAGVDYIPVEHAGLQTLNGLQATAYSRIRYTSGGDLARAERQRTVLTQIAKKSMTMNPATLNKIADTVFGEISTSLELSEILELLSGIAEYKIGETAGFPFNDYVKPNGYVGNASVVVPVDLKKNVILLHQFLFDETEYTPSETVNKCSQKIAADTGVSYNGE